MPGGGGGRARVIDVGGGNGAFAIEAADAGYEAWLQEISDVNQNRLAQAGVKWVSELTPDLDGQFDAVTLWDVFEHVWPHKEFLIRLRSLLKLGGKIVIEIPSPSRMTTVFRVMSRLSSRRRVKALGHIVNFTHLQLMTKNELVATMPLHGFKVVHATRYSEFSYRGEEYVRRFIPNGVIASALGRMLDQHWFRWSTIGCNKTFLVGEKTDS